jgi:DNA-binding IclR family transcriptional regulator
VSKASKVSTADKRQRRLGQAQVRIVDTLKASPGGKLNDASVRGVAKLLGLSKSTVHNALSALVAGGIVTKVGTGLALTAAA